jgi:hypothetical protein
MFIRSGRDVHPFGKAEEAAIERARAKQAAE